MEAHIEEWLQLTVELELAFEVLDQNMSALDAIRNARGAIGRVNEDVAKTVGEVAALEQEAKELAKAAVAAPLKEIGAVKAELHEMINELAQLSNGAPGGPLPGSESQSTTSDGSTENPT